MWVTLYLLVPVFVSIFEASCQEKSSLTFVIDNTLSMYDDIYQVKINAAGISKVVFDEKASQIQNMVLVTFNDPETKLVKRTEDRHIFQEAINNVRVYGGGDCPEMAMTGIIKALEASLNGSFVYVFTDAAALDYRLGNEVKNLCQKKQSQIVFVLTGYCTSRESLMYQVYHDIAAACSGLAFEVQKFEVNQILSTIKETIIGNKTVLTTKKIPAYVTTDISFEIDDQTEYAIVTASGSHVLLQISGPRAEQERLTWLTNVKTIKLYRPTPGKYTATVRGNSQTSVYVVGRSDFFFTHGFSQQEPKSLMDTTPQPIANSPTQLSISVTDPKHTVDILLVRILNMDENIVNSIPLKPLSKDFYTTATAFKAPSYRFKIAVIGKETRTGKYIQRISKLPITPQEPPKVVPKSIKPSVIITEGEATYIDYGKTTKLTCKVTAYPEPIIEWTKIDDPKTKLTFQSFPVEPPYKYISYLALNEVSENGTYICRAKNDAGDTATKINVVVGDPFIINYAIKGITEIEYDKTSSLVCDITASVPMHITWNYIEENTGVRNIITESNDKFSITKGGTVLIINKMTLDMIGTYVCQATLDKDTRKKSVHQTRVKIRGLEVAKVTGEESKTVNVGEPVDILCRVTGVPKPTIIWQFKAEDGNEIGNKKDVTKQFDRIAGSQNILHISNVNINHAGSYKCIAHNVLGDSEHITKLIVQIPPNIVSNTTKVYKSIEGQDATLEIPCKVTGLPKPIITWTLNGVTLSESTKFSINDGNLVIREPQVSDSNMYKCEAKNDGGSTHAVFQADILQAPEISGEKSKTIRMGDLLDIVCKVNKGVPKPKLTWSFKAKNSSEFVLLKESAEIMRISKAHRRLTGTYQCVASNVVGNDEHLTTLVVEFAPVILSNPSAIIEGIEGDVALVVPCKAIGEPKPSITWKMNADVIRANSHYVINDEALIIKNPTRNDSKSYTCEAKNYLGAEQATFTTAVKEHLDEYGPTQVINIKRGDSINLECVSNADASQSIRWFIEGVDTGIKGNSYHLSNADVSMDGNYTCRVSRMNGSNTKTYVVVIGFPPRFSMNQEETIYEFTGNEDDELSCAVDAKPTPDITWTFNGEVLRDVKSMDLSMLNWGNYTCNVTNVHGSVQRSFKVVSSSCLISRQPKNIRGMPLILTTSGKWPVLDSTKDYLLIEPDEKLIFSCPNAEDKPNSLEKLPGLNETIAICNKQDIFTVDGKPFKVSDLQCAQESNFIVNNKHTKCLTDTSELMRIGFEANGFLETYELCFDKSEKIPLYARVMMSKSNRGLGTVYPWYRYPGIEDGNNEAVYTCETQSSKSCYGKRQLVNASDVSDGPAQRSTYIDYLNSIPYWRPSDIKESPWDVIEEMIKLRLSIFDQFVVWSGTHTLEKKNGGVVPRYLWKVVRLAEDEATAIIYINGPSPSKADILCKNICPDKYGVPWFPKVNKYIYCCDLNDFLEAFDLSGNTIGESLDSALDKITSKEY